MKTCRRCGRTAAPKRTVCSSCRSREQRLRKRGPAPSAPPLEVAVAAVQNQRAERNLRSEHAALVDEVSRLRAALGEVEKVKVPEVIVYRQRAEERSDAVACAIASDWHIEEPVDPAAVNGLNAYDLDVARARAENFFRHTVKLASIFAREQRITTIDLQVLGDMFTGWLHEESIANTLLAPGDAATEFARIFASGVQHILDESDFNITGIMLPGNHGRLTKKIHYGDPTGTSLETVAYHAIAQKFENNPRVQFDVARHAVVYRRFHERFIVRHIHGYEVRYGGGIGGITIPLNKRVARWDTATLANLTVLGHFHQKFDGGSFLANGSLIGYNEYAQGNGFGYEPAQQVFYLIDARNGGEKTVVAPVFV